MSHMKEALTEDHLRGWHDQVPHELCGMCIHRPLADELDQISREPISEPDALLPVGAEAEGSDSMPTAVSSPAPGMFKHVDGQDIAMTILWPRRHHEPAWAQCLTELVKKHDPALEATVMMGWLYDV